MKILSVRSRRQGVRVLPFLPVRSASVRRCGYAAYAAIDPLGSAGVGTLRTQLSIHSVPMTSASVRRSRSQGLAGDPGGISRRCNR